MNAKETLIETIGTDVESEQNKDEQAIMLELVGKLEGMIADRDNKCASAKEQLVESLKITADKYRTATGVYEAFKLLQSINANATLYNSEYNTGTSMIANNMSALAESMARVASNLKYEEMDTLCENFYNGNFSSSEFNEFTLVEELMKLDLCRNVGPAAEDMTQFYKSAQKEIDDTVEEINSLIVQYPLLEEFVPEGLIPTKEPEEAEED